MNQQTPNPEAFQRAAQRLNEACYQLDALNIQFDELIAKIEEDIRRSSLTQYRLRKAKQVSEPD
jgi:hypothetical protein